MFRESCLDCYRKHVGQAIALFTESALGYESHFWLAIGHLAEAETETINSYPELAKTTRNYRLQIMDLNKVDLMSLIAMATEIAEDESDKAVN